MNPICVEDFTSLYDLDLPDRSRLRGAAVIVAGGEARGPRGGVLERCNVRVSIPLDRGVESLNVSVAVGLVLFEAVRQRRVAGRRSDPPIRG